MPDRVVCVASFADPGHEAEKLRVFYEAMAEARRDAGQLPVPFHRFAELVREQVQALRAGPAGEVAFRVTLQDGKVNLTARALKGVAAEEA